jgi:class 3 adenylate cyclase
VIPIQSGNIWPLWLPAGLAQSVLILYGRQMFPGITIGSLLYSLIFPVPSMAAGVVPVFAIVSAINNTLQALLGWFLLKQCNFCPQLSQVRDVLKLFMLAAIIPSALSAAIGVIAFFGLAGIGSWSIFGETWFYWWIGNVTGILTLMPVLLTWSQWPAILKNHRRLFEGVLCLACLVLVSLFVFLYSTQNLAIKRYPFEYLIFPLIIWASLRFEQPGAALASVIVTNIATWGLTQKMSPFLRDNFTTAQAMQSLQAFICILTLTALILAAVMAERKSAQRQVENLLLNILPSPIADRLKLNEQAIADHFAEVTVLFADIVDFTHLAASLSPTQVVTLLNEIFSNFDALADKYGLEKIKTIGDAYMVVGGLPSPRPDHAQAVADLALDMQVAISNFRHHHADRGFDMRIGINTGPVVAGVIGRKKFLYDLWGDTVNVASRMEALGIAGKIQVTETTYSSLKHQFQFQERGPIHVKGRGEMVTYFLTGRLLTSA